MKKQKIIFLNSAIDVRGTSVALYDYAHFNEELLSNESWIIAPLNAKHDPQAQKKFQNRWPSRFKYFRNREELSGLLGNGNIIYTIKYGKKSEGLGMTPQNKKLIVHCVFDMSEPHGDVYAGVSRSIALKFNKKLWVPHMINLSPGNPQENLRSVLGIPPRARVFGRHGGMDTFDLGWARLTIRDIVLSNPMIYFVFVNTPQFFEHPQIKYLDKIISSHEKNLFIQTCDAHLECGTMGHSFGLSMGEFSINNKPIIAYNGGIPNVWEPQSGLPRVVSTFWNTAHLDILGGGGIYYKNSSEFRQILLGWVSEYWKKQDNNYYKQYSPSLVMQQFKNVFIDSNYPQASPHQSRIENTLGCKPQTKLEM